VTGATQGSAQKTDKKEITGAFWEGKQSELVRCSEPSKKGDFFEWRGVFFLTRPLMGDPFVNASRT